MRPFAFSRATDPADAIRQGVGEGTRYLGGGTNLVDLMREGVERPNALVDVTGLSSTITEQPAAASSSARPPATPPLPSTASSAPATLC